MDFSFTEEQTLLRNSVQRFLTEKYDFETRRKILRTADGWRADYWQAFAELGILGVPFSEADGGLGGGPIETMIVMEEFGRALALEPYFACVVLAGGFLRASASAAQREEFLGPLIAGELILAHAWAESRARFDLFDVSVRAKRSGAGYILSGTKISVLGAPQAHKLIVSARTGGSGKERAGLSLFLVDRAAKGVSERAFRGVDGRLASEITFENTMLGNDHLLGPEGGAADIIEQVADEAITALCAESLGAMKALHDQTLEFVKARQQFGQPIGKFQVIQHRLADMFVAYEQSVSITYRATLSLNDAPKQRALAAAAAKAHVGRAAKFIGQCAVQIHGGMGMTDELPVGHYFKRLTMLDLLFGNSDHHVKRFAQSSAA